MIESISATSFLGHSLLLGHYVRNDSVKPGCFLRFSRFRAIKSRATELAKESNLHREKERFPRGFEGDIGIEKPGSWPPENRADNLSLKNPLVRQERMGCGWLGVIFEWEGVLIDENPDLENQSWVVLSREERKSPPPGFVLRRIEGMKTEHAISEVLCWTRDPSQLKRMSSRKDAIHRGLQSGTHRFRDGSREFVNVLTRYKIPMALVSTRGRAGLEAAIGGVGIEGVFAAVVTAEDVYRGKPDPEMFVYAAELLRLIPERCIVFGNSNLTVEAAHDARMKCVAVASKHRVYELNAADLVVRWLDELSVIDLKNLADVDLDEFGSTPEVEMEVEGDGPRPAASAAAVDGGLW